MKIAQPAPAVAISLQPFGSILETTVIPEVSQFQWEDPGHAELERIGAALDRSFRARLGHPLHQAIMIHGLKVAAACYQDVVLSDENAALSQREVADMAIGLLRQMEDFWGIYDFNLLIS